MKIRTIMLAGLIGLGGALGAGMATASDDDRPFCGSIEANCTHRFATTLAVATNEFEKFKWDFMRKLDKLGTDASDEDKQDLVDIFCDKFTIRGEVYGRTLKRATRRCNRGLRRCECFNIPARQMESCRRGFKANVARRSFSYRAQLHTAVWECCREVEELAGLGES